MKKIFALLTILAAWLCCSAQSSEQRPQILILGTYHMANPGHDIYNMKADDVLAPKRQQEIANFIDVLEKFHPTKIAVEADAGSERITREYNEYVAGRYTLSGNEIDQIGYRLAKELGHKTVYPVDESGEFPYERVANWAKANGRSQQFEAMGSQIALMVREQDEFLHSHTVLEMLEYINSDANVARAVSYYYADVPFSDPGDYAGPDLLAKWFQRNIRIYSNIVRLVDSPTDRILVIYGAGHLGWLQQDVSNDQSVKLIKLSEVIAQR